MPSTMFFGFTASLPVGGMSKFMGLDELVKWKKPATTQPPFTNIQGGVLNLALEGISHQWKVNIQAREERENIYLP